MTTPQNKFLALFLAGLARPRTGSSTTDFVAPFPFPLPATAALLTARLFFAGDARPGIAPSSLSPLPDRSIETAETLLPNDGASMRGANDLMPGIPENVVAEWAFLGVLKFCTMGAGAVAVVSFEAVNLSFLGAGRERVLFAACCSGLVCEDGATSAGRRDVVDDRRAFAGVAMRDLRFGAGAAVAALGFVSSTGLVTTSDGSVVDGVGRVRRDRVFVGDSGGASVVIGFWSCGRSPARIGASTFSTSRVAGSDGLSWK